jgi:glycosyltransferase involved in cell wall biosynthesis
MKLYGMLRIKNEGRWIRRVLDSIAPLCPWIFVFDDHSTDNTLAEVYNFMLETGHKMCIMHSQFQGINETRDKNYIVSRMMNKPSDDHDEMPDGYESPDWILHIDGDEVLEPAGVHAIRAAIQSNSSNCYGLRVLYLWNDDHTIRTDGIYREFVRQSLFNTRTTNGTFNPTEHGKGTAANLHCTNVPEDLRNKALWIPGARLLHYGYFDRAMRLAKWDFYNTVDPDNVLEDRYRHVVAGDIPEVPAHVRTKWAGPLTLEPYVPLPMPVESNVECGGLVNA